MHFSPVGRTGAGGSGIFRPGKTLSDFERGRVLLLQIESSKGLACMEDMPAAYGDFIDGFVIGPNDFSIVCGIPFEHSHPLMLRQHEQFFSVCPRHK